MTGGRVFIVNEPVRKDEETGEWRTFIDFSDAGRYGTLVTLSKPGRVLATSYKEEGEKLNKALADFDPTKDYVLLAGDVVLCCLVMTILFQTNCDYVNVLSWRNHKRDYLNVRVPNPDLSREGYRQDA